MGEINLMDRYPKSPRPIEERAVDPERQKHVEMACQFGKDYFDGERSTGYGGYYYHPRFWTETIKRFKEHYDLSPDASILDIGCAKGFMLYDFKQLMPDAHISGMDVSEYALDHAMLEVRPHLRRGSAVWIPFEDHSFDLVVSINTLHNLDLNGIRRAMREIQRVGRGRSFITMDAWRNDEERDRLLDWNLTAKTYMHVDDWRKFFKEVEYTGDYYWFIAE